VKRKATTVPWHLTKFSTLGLLYPPLHQSWSNLACRSEPLMYDFTPNFISIGVYFYTQQNIARDRASCRWLLLCCLWAECPECRRPGHICHPVTGECVCPPLTEGYACERCQANAWGHDPLTGCKVCHLLMLRRDAICHIFWIFLHHDSLLWSPYGIGQTIIFSSCRLFFFFFFFSLPNLSHRRLGVCHTCTRGVSSVRI